MAGRYMLSERSDHTLQATALVHEAYLQLVDQQDAGWESRRHFFGVAAGAMRRVLVDHARARNADKRAHPRNRVLLDEAEVIYDEHAIDVLALDEALERLGALDVQLAKIVELCFFAGLTHAEAGRVLGVSTRTVERGWALARAWLRGEIGEAEPDAS
jgi:RNA polymerase sigma factor (TIGR02999 family)